MIANPQLVISGLVRSLKGLVGRVKSIEDECQNIKSSTKSLLEMVDESKILGSTEFDYYSDIEYRGQFNIYHMDNADPGTSFSDLKLRPSVMAKLVGLGETARSIFDREHVAVPAALSLSSLARAFNHFIGPISRQEMTENDFNEWVHNLVESRRSFDSKSTSDMFKLSRSDDYNQALEILLESDELDEDQCSKLTSLFEQIGNLDADFTAVTIKNYMIAHATDEILEPEIAVLSRDPSKVSDFRTKIRTGDGIARFFNNLKTLARHIVNRSYS